MRPPLRHLSFVGAFLLCGPAMVHAQTGNQQRQRAKRFAVEYRAGTEQGTIVWVRALSAQGKKTGMLAIRRANGAQFNADLTPQTQYLAAGVALPPTKIQKLLTRGVPVELNWRAADDTDGRIVEDIRIRTIEITGEIKLVNAARVVVIAKPKPKPEEEEAQPPIEVQGRETDPETKKKDKPKEIAPRTLTLPVARGVTAVTLNGKPAKVTALKAKMAFDGIVIDGGTRAIIELHARSDSKDDAAEPDGDKGDDPKGDAAKDRRRKPETKDGTPMSSADPNIPSRPRCGWSPARPEQGEPRRRPAFDGTGAIR